MQTYFGAILNTVSELAVVSWKTRFHCYVLMVEH